MIYPTLSYHHIIMGEGGLMIIVRKVHKNISALLLKMS